MSTPIGHSLAGLLVLRLSGHKTSCPASYWFVFTFLAANAADLDFLPGLLVGNANVYHQGASHSILAACLFGCFSMLGAFWLKAPARLVFVVGTLSYLSHLLLDMFVLDQRAPVGIPLAWPLYDGYWHFTPLLSGVSHGVPGDSFTQFLQAVFSGHNLIAMGKEIVFLLPLLGLIWYGTRRRWMVSKN